VEREEHLNLVRLTGEQREALFRRLDGGEIIGRPSESERRNERRWSFRREGVSLTVEHPDGSVSRFLILARNLSANGMAFIHGRFVHPTTRCYVRLHDAVGDEQVVNGQVLECRHLEGALHEVRVSFEGQIEPAEYVNTPEDEDDDILAETTELAELRGRVLHVADDDVDARLLAHRLAATGLTVTRVSGADRAAEAAQAVPYEVVVVEPTAGVPVVAIRHLRRCGCQGTIILATAEIDPRRLADQAEGADFVLHKPYPPEELYLLLIRLLLQSEAEGKTDVVYSTMEHERDASDLLESYIDHARNVAARIEEAVHEQNVEKLRTACLDLHGTATTHGLEPLGNAAAAAIEMLEQSATVEDVIDQVHRVTHMCRRLAVRDLRD
jgi:DNA-binding response OmpR family regulator